MFPSKRQERPRISHGEIVPYASATIQELEFGLPPPFQVLCGRSEDGLFRPVFGLNLILCLGLETNLLLSGNYQPGKTSRPIDHMLQVFFAVGVTAATRAATTMTSASINTHTSVPMGCIQFLLPSSFDAAREARRLCRRLG